MLKPVWIICFGQYIYGLINYISTLNYVDFQMKGTYKYVHLYN